MAPERGNRGEKASDRGGGADGVTSTVTVARGGR